LKKALNKFLITKPTTPLFTEALSFKGKQPVAKPLLLLKKVLNKFLTTKPTTPLFTEALSFKGKQPASKPQLLLYSK